MFYIWYLLHFGLSSIKNKVLTSWKWTWIRSHYMLFSCRLSIFDLCHQIYVTLVIIMAQSHWIVRKTAMVLCYYTRWTRLFKESLKVNNISRKLNKAQPVARSVRRQALALSANSSTRAKQAERAKREYMHSC